MQTFSTDDLGWHLGVSGRTVGRWESGQSSPSAPDIERIADLLQLVPSQRAFLLRAFAQMPEAVPPPLQSHFDESARKILLAPFPVVLLDSLYYVRGINRYGEMLFPQSQSAYVPGGHFLITTLGVRDLTMLDNYQRARVRTWIRHVWLLTATLCGLPAYRHMLNELSVLPLFRDLWVESALDPEGWPVFGAPLTLDLAGRGCFRVYSCHVDFPPLYYVREYVPMDGAGRATLDAIRAESVPLATLYPVTHWSEFKSDPTV